jgi:methylglyoxal synthase
MEAHLHQAQRTPNEIDDAISSLNHLTQVARDKKDQRLFDWAMGARDVLSWILGAEESTTGHLLAANATLAELPAIEGPLDVGERLRQAANV